MDHNQTVFLFIYIYIYWDWSLCSVHIAAKITQNPVQRQLQLQRCSTAEQASKAATANARQNIHPKREVPRRGEAALSQR